MRISLEPREGCVEVEDLTTNQLSAVAAIMMGLSAIDSHAFHLSSGSAPCPICAYQIGMTEPDDYCTGVTTDLNVAELFEQNCLDDKYWFCIERWQGDIPGEKTVTVQHGHNIDAVCTSGSEAIARARAVIAANVHAAGGVLEVGI